MPQNFKSSEQHKTSTDKNSEETSRKPLLSRAKRYRLLKMSTPTISAPRKPFQSIAERLGYTAPKKPTEAKEDPNPTEEEEEKEDPVPKNSKNISKRKRGAGHSWSKNKKKKPSDFARITHLKFYDTDDDEEAEEWFKVWWPDGSWSYQMASILVIGKSDCWVRWLKEVKDKGNGKHTPRTSAGGAREIDVLTKPLQLSCVVIRSHRSRITKIEQGLLVEDPGSQTPGSTQDVEIQYQSANDSCVPLSLCNLLGCGKKKKKKLMGAFAHGTKFGGFNDLARVSEAILKKTLARVHGMILKSLVLLDVGQYLIMDGTHCVGVDCARGLVFDCAEKWVLPLTVEALTRCQINSIDEIRIVT
jgi:hypothetical protein